MNEEQQTFYYLGVALTIGLLIGAERGWQERKAEEGARIAGVRTHGLIGLLGGIVSLISDQLGPLTLGLAFIGMTGALATVYVANLNTDNKVGITSLVAALLTFALGALAATGATGTAAAVAVVTTLLLGYKPTLHRWLSRLENHELHAAIKLLLISVVLLPLLPNEGYGPGKALNPYTIWWMVVLIATISFVGYFAIKIGGTRQGILFTGLFGGLASSTAVTLQFSRMAKSEKTAVPMLAVGILLACGTMWPRMILLAALLNSALLIPLLIPALVMTVLVLLPILFYWTPRAEEQIKPHSLLENPLELKTALVFGLILATVMLLGKLLRNWFGDAGLLALAGISGITDVNAITLLLARMSTGDLVVEVAVMGIALAAATGNLAKAVLVVALGGIRIGCRVGIPLLLSSIGGVLTAWWWIWLPSV